MRNIPILILTFLVFNSCKQHDNKEKVLDAQKAEYTLVSTDRYELHKPSTEPKAVLILFGGYPEVAKDIKREFKILEKAKANQIAIIYSNLNKKLWFEENELNELSSFLQKIFTDNSLPNDNIYFGGFSSGGDVALLIGDYLTKNSQLVLAPKGIFIVDSPIDLAQLYFSSEKNLQRNFSEVSVQESNWLIKTLGDRFGNPNESLQPYEKYSVFTQKTGNISNIKNLKETKIRLYTEPDSLWWKENRMADFDQTNAFLIKELSETLIEAGFTHTEYIATENRGYRSNNERHPHSWAIVETGGLINWILNQ